MAVVNTKLVDALPPPAAVSPPLEEEVANAQLPYEELYPATVVTKPLINLFYFPPFQKTTFFFLFAVVGGGVSYAVFISIIFPKKH